jgi:hypothetical protein
MSTKQSKKPFGNATAGSITPLGRLVSRAIVGSHCEGRRPGRKNGKTI